jgi:hypothetical protein
MHSFHHSRSRILFEVLCALAISASCGGAWMQTGAWALLPAAAVAALYGVVHSFDLRRRNSIDVVETQEIELATDRQVDPLAHPETGEQPVADNELEVAHPAREAERVEPAAPRGSQGSKAKVRPKGSSRRAGASGKAKVIELAPSDAETPYVPPPEDAARPHIEPLFEPETFARMPRQAFGRKARY